MTTPPAPPSPADAALPDVVVDGEGVRRLSAVPYVARAGFRPIELDLVLPPDSTVPHPVVVFLHGGGWRSGDRRTVGPAYRTREVFTRFARSGIAVASIDYRLSAEAIWPAPLHDAAEALAWLRRRGAEVGLDGERIAVWGESAGAHLAVLLGLAGPPLLADVARVRAVAAWYAPSDLVRLPDDLGVDPADDSTREALLLGTSVAAAPRPAAEASPVTHVAAPAPPFLLLHGRDDHLVPCVQSERLHEALRGAGVSSTFTAYDGADHLWLGAPAAAADALDRTVAFLGEALGR